MTRAPNGSSRKFTKIMMLTCIFITSCQPIVSEQDLVGIYTLNSGAAEDSLELRSDQTYRRVYAAEGETVQKDEGTWELEKRNGSARLVLSNFIPRWSVRPNRSAAPGYWSTYVQRIRKNEFRIVVDEDLGWSYERLAR
jgi:hypothetical protein